MTTRQFGCFRVLDGRDDGYPLLANHTHRISRYWIHGFWYGDQESSPHDVPHAWLHWVEAVPVNQKVYIPPRVSPEWFYDRCRESDRENNIAGEHGVSLRSGARVLKRLGWLSSYYWTTDLDTLVDGVLNHGPLVAALGWRESMMVPNASGWLDIDGEWLGMHAVLVNGVNRHQEKLRIENSFGKSWGKKGAAFLSFTDMQRLLSAGGVACYPVRL